jgi:hypothetical protein
MQTITIQRGNVTIILHRPELTEEEQKHAERNVLIALQQFGKITQDSKKHLHN